jgi:hypothetical protein
VWLTASQWELLVAADGQRTPADLAQLLGRAGFATVQELRRLAAQGLLELPEVRADAPEFVRLPRAGGTAVDVKRPPVRVDEPPLVPAVSATATVPASSPPAETETARTPRLARRKPGAKLPKDLAAEPPPVHTGTDEVLLKRIRTALRALR